MIFQVSRTIYVYYGYGHPLKLHNWAVQLSVFDENIVDFILNQV